MLYRSSFELIYDGVCFTAQNIKCRPMFFAQRLYKSMKGAGTDDLTLIRIVMSRSEVGGY